MPCLSIIIPVYNVAPFLDDCLRSVLGQHFQDIEVICVNDGSTDESPYILRKWHQKDSRILIINQENKGLSASRNRGLKIAKGKYVTFVDSDDMVCEDIYTTAIETMEHNQLDAYIFGYKTFPNGKSFPTHFTTNTVLSPKELLQSCKQIQTKNALCFCCRFIYRRSILKNNDISFEERIRIGEDMIYNIDAVLHSNRLMASDSPKYLYRKNNATSLMALPYKDYLEKSFSIMYETKKIQIDKYNLWEINDYPFDLSSYIIRTYIPLMIKNEYSNPSKPNITDSIKRILSMKMVRDAFSIIGFRNIYPSWKEFIFYLALKYKLVFVVKRYYDKVYAKHY